VEDADLVLQIVDGSTAQLDDELIRIPETSKQLLILNKLDLGIHADWDAHDGVSISCTEEKGISALEDAVVKVLAEGDEAWGNNLVAINARHQDCLARALNDLDQAAAGFTEQGQSSQPEVIALELRSALDHVGEIVGQVDAEEILGEIFSSFCIGK